MDDSSNAKLNNLLGLALKAMVEGGADLAHIATFSETYRPLFAKELGMKTEPPVDLKAVIAEAVSQVLGAMPGPRARKPKQRINVIDGGKRTSVTVDPDRLQRLSHAVGGIDQAREVLQQLIDTKPKAIETGGRSTWLNGQIDTYLNLQKDSVSQSTHRH